LNEDKESKDEILAQLKTMNERLKIMDERLSYLLCITAVILIVSTFMALVGFYRSHFIFIKGQFSTEMSILAKSFKYDYKDF
jgi:hypothetical protein